MDMSWMLYKYGVIFLFHSFHSFIFCFIHSDVDSKCLDWCLTQRNEWMKAEVRGLLGRLRVISHKANWLFLPIHLEWYMTDMQTSVLQLNYDRIHSVLLASFLDGLEWRFGILYFDVSCSNFRWGSGHITFSGKFGANTFSDHNSEI